MFHLGLFPERTITTRFILSLSVRANFRVCVSSTRKHSFGFFALTRGTIDSQKHPYLQKNPHTSSNIYIPFLRNTYFYSLHILPQEITWSPNGPHTFLTSTIVPNFLGGTDIIPKVNKLSLGSTHVPEISRTLQIIHIITSSRSPIYPPKSRFPHPHKVPQIPSIPPQVP